MNQGKLEKVKQEMARGNVDILDISNLKWIGMHEFNSDDHFDFLHFKISADADFSHEIKMLAPWKKSYEKPR